MILMMYQRKEKGERSNYGHQEDILDLFVMLESSDPETIESVKTVIHENLTATKDSRLLNGLVDYYLTVQSQRSLDILLRVKDPHDKHLFDRINELMKNETSRYQSLQFLCTLVYRQPSWLHKIANHRVMNTILNLLKTGVNAPNLLSALYIIICLLPMIPSQFGPLLSDTFEIFSRLVAWNLKKPSAISETYVLHLQTGVYSLFHRLYGMFPCNFLAYLRSYYGGRDYSRENYQVFSLFIKPMLERVRLHPLLVTASKEAELSVNRWKKMAYHDIIVDCATISLDTVEGTLEGLRGRNQPLHSVARNQGVTFTQDSLQYISLSSQSSTLSVSVEPGSTVNDAACLSQETMWSPAHACGFSSPPALAAHISPFANKNELAVKNLSAQLSIEENVPLDLAVEAKAETVEDKTCVVQNRPLSKTFSRDSKSTDSDAGFSAEDYEKQSSLPHQKELCQVSSSEKEASYSEVLNLKLDKTVLQAVEAREDDIDKEVSELTSSPNTSQKDSAEVRHDTPFCSTTQNLTDEPTDLHKSSSSNLEMSDSLPKNACESTDEMYNSIHENDMEYVPSYNRYRYFSHCGPPPDIPASAKKRKTFRSLSCPANFCPSVKVTSDNILNCDNTELSKSETVVVTCSSNVITSSSAFVPFTSNSVITNTTITYEHLIPMAMEPLSDLRRSANSNTESSYTHHMLFNSPSPSELLDNFIQLGSVTYSNQLSAIPITSTKNTDWTHFGGKPPPDEIAILRNQILLLHNQLLFERYRKDVHSERNRRILGRAKKSRMQEEEIVALKEQISLLEKDNQELKSELVYQSKLYHQLRTEKKLMENELNLHIKKVSQENTQLQFSNKKMQSLLVSQKEENDAIRAKCAKCLSELLNLKFELELCNRKMMHCEQIKKDATFMSKQLVLLQELNSHYKDKIDMMKEIHPQDIGRDLMKESACIEIKDLKQRLEFQKSLFESSKSRVAELEIAISNMKSKQKDQTEIIENMKSFHKSEMEVLEERLRDLRKVAVLKDAYILELHKEIESLSAKLKSSGQQENGACNSVRDSDDSADCQLPLNEICETTQSSFKEESNSDIKILKSDSIEP